MNDRRPILRILLSPNAWLAAALLLGAVPARALTAVYYYKATVSIPVIRIVNIGGKDKLETKTLKDKDIINIALGQALGTSVGKQILAVRAPEHPDDPGAPVPRLFIYDLDTKTVVKELASISAMDFDYFQPQSTGSVSGFGTLAFGDTGASAVAKFYVATLKGAAKASGSANPFDFDPRVAGTTTAISGRMSFDFTDNKGVFAHFEGVMTSGKLAISGKTIAIEQE